MILTLFTIPFVTNAQEKKKLYFLADTVTIPKENRVLEIADQYEIFYIFYCKCLTYKEDITFSYIPQKQKKPVTLSNKPDQKYISWKELIGLINNYPKGFDAKYELYITEVLPNKKFIQNKVKINTPSPYVDDSVIIKQ